MTGTRILPSCPGWVRPSPSRGPSRQTGTYLTGALAPSEPSNAGAATDPDWTTYEIPEAALAVMYPSSWARSTDPLMPNLVDPSELVALSTFPARPGGENRAHMPENAIEDMADRCSGRHPGTAWRPRRRHSRGRGLSEATRTVRSGHRLSQRGGPLPRPAQGVFRPLYTLQRFRPTLLRLCRARSQDPTRGQCGGLDDPRPPRSRAKVAAISARPLLERGIIAPHC
jgi:hypothetical protein